ncbi:MAG: glycogen debranching enzyme family protein [Acetobacteraceae bacterium]|nr:glycogen debranching enzyme family protein [Acetobacteraceae bacterium]
MTTPDLATEWLEADGLGGFASGTAGLVRTRRYHALLLTARTPPSGRVVLVNGIEAWLEAGSERIALTTQQYGGGVQSPDGATRITDFTARPWPCWTFDVGRGATIRQDILVARDTCETVLRWRGAGAGRLHVRLLMSGRDYHSLHHENPAFAFDAVAVQGGNVAWRPYPGGPAVAALSNGGYRPEPEWYRGFFYAAEHERGLDDDEDLASPGVFTWDLDTDDALLILRAGDTLNVRVRPYAARLIAAETARRNRFASAREASAAAYVVDRGAGRTILAGFPWFTDWGRDTFIAMRGLVLGMGRLAEAATILHAWAGTVGAGMLPNRFPDSGDVPEYNSVDASLWYIIAVNDYVAACTAGGQAADPLLFARLGATVGDILDGYAAGTRFGIGADSDGLLRAGVPGVQLTWMDAKVGDWVVTPRIGKPVEVQALWINALRIGGRWSDRWRTLEGQARAAFLARFPDPETGGLADVVDAGHVAGAVDRAIRPNQIFAAGGLPFPVVSDEAARGIVACVERHLLTPAGLRTLAPDDPAYVGRYEGDGRKRDGAYHQGTVWPWLTGAFVDAWLRVKGGGEAAKAEGRQRFLQPLLDRLHVAGLGHLSEIADGDPPHTPRGCPFQAWSLGELIRIEAMLGGKP